MSIIDSKVYAITREPYWVHEDRWMESEYKFPVPC